MNMFTVPSASGPGCGKSNESSGQLWVYVPAPFGWLVQQAYTFD